MIGHTKAALALTSLHQSLNQTGLTDLEAARSALVWVSTPTAEQLSTQK